MHFSHRSYTEKLFAARRRRKFLARLAVFLTFIALFRSFVIQSWTISSPAMGPALEAGDRVFVSALLYGPKTLFGRLPSIARPDRGDIVLVEGPALPFESGWTRALDSIARFFTFQRWSPLGKKYGAALSSPTLCRVVGLPGDSLRYAREGFEIRRKGSDTYFAEASLTEKPYMVKMPDSVGSDIDGEAARRAEAWGEIALGENEYFVAFDDRTLAGASGLWGLIGGRRISGKMVLLYWPLSRAGSR